MNTKLKQKIAFTLSMGIVTTGIISFVLLALNLGFSNEFALAWLRSSAVGYVIHSDDPAARPLTASASRSSGQLSQSYREGN